MAARREEARSCNPCDERNFYSLASSSNYSGVARSRSQSHVVAGCRTETVDSSTEYWHQTRASPYGEIPVCDLPPVFWTRELRGPQRCPKGVNNRPNSRRRLRHKAIVRVPSDSGGMDAPSRQIEKEKQIAGAKTSHSPGFDGEEVRAIR